MAGPGSGKTFTATQRLKHLVWDMKVEPDSILSITFTRLAALEMRSRAQTVLGDAAGAIHFSTFHSLFFKILKNTYRFTSDNIIKPHVKIQILKDALAEENIEPLRGTSDVLELLNEISACKCAADREHFSSRVIGDEEFAKIFGSYCRKCSSLKLIDFDDMPLKCRELFKTREEVLKKWQEIFKFIQIDEFQDIDPVQFELIKMLADGHKNIFAVGDDDQSIYSFRGSDNTIMLDFKKHYPEAQTYVLSDNYRSGETIVRAASLVISENKTRIKKDIKSRNPGRGSLNIRCFKNEEEERKSIIAEIRSGDIRLSDICVLYRTNSLCERMAEELSSVGIKFRCREKLANIYESKTARDLTDYLRLATGVKLRSTMLRIMNHPYRFISRECVRSDEFDFNIMKEYHRYDKETVKRIEKLERDIGALGRMKPYGAIHYILNGMGYLRYIRSDKDKHRAVEGEKAALEILARSKGYKSHGEFLNSIEEYTKELAIAEARASRAGIKGDDEAVSLMTYHASKGLEFKEVYLPSVNEGIIPGHRIVTPEEFEEERRLFYVGMTRAKDSLKISYCMEVYGEKEEYSRFLGAILDKNNIKIFGESAKLYTG